MADSGWLITRDPMNSKDLQNFITARAITAEIVYMPVHTPTVETAAVALGVGVDQIVKSIVLLADTSPILMVATGTARIDLKRLADHLKLPRKRVKLAEAQTVFELTGFVVGSMPPFGHTQPLRTLIDERVFAQSVVFGGGGDLDAMLQVSPAEVLRVSSGERVQF